MYEKARAADRLGLQVVQHPAARKELFYALAMQSQHSSCDVPLAAYQGEWGVACVSINFNPIIRPLYIELQGLFVSFNLISDAWLPIRRASGARETVRPGDLTTGLADDPIVGLNFPRPDWNAAVTEWLIGLTFLARRPADEDDWEAAFREPPSANALAAAFSPFAFAFDLSGEGPRAFQDFDLLADAEPKSLSSLLMDAPGENTIKNNADLFVKRGGAERLSLPLAAAALITLQTYAPSGGAGHRTSLRGGGPLTTLVSPRRRRAEGLERQTLWDKVWANVPEVDFDPVAANGQTPCTSPEWTKVFPWLASTKSSPSGEIVAPHDATPAQAFFACPRRIRLRISSEEAACDLSGDVGPVANGLVTVNYGANYLGWTHPLSPYRQDKKSGKLPLHPHAGASDYGDGAAWWGLEDEAALVVRLWDGRRRTVRDLIGAEGVEAFGFDMDNMKARQWLEVRFPWVPVYGADGRDLRELLRQMIQASDEAARSLRYTVKLALYGQRHNAGGYKLPDTLPRDALPEPAEQLWRETEPAFRGWIDKLVKAVDGEDGTETTPLKHDWLRELNRAASGLFERFVDLDGLTDANPHRLLSARQSLAKALSPYGAVAKALQINRTRKERV
jgi:CRISPR system Cascade subunit CasA